jgi:hypothetical protein
MFEMFRLFSTAHSPQLRRDAPERALAVVRQIHD